jgi:hypothetical protein
VVQFVKKYHDQSNYSSTTDIELLCDSHDRADHSAIEKVDIHAALFDDGTLFEAGTLFKRNPDPSALQKWVKIETS